MSEPQSVRKGRRELIGKRFRGKFTKHAKRRRERKGNGERERKGNGEREREGERER